MLNIHLFPQPSLTLLLLSYILHHLVSFLIYTHLGFSETITILLCELFLLSNISLYTSPLFRISRDVRSILLVGSHGPYGFANCEKEEVMRLDLT